MLKSGVQSAADIPGVDILVPILRSPICPDLFLTFVCDKPFSADVVNDFMLEKWGISYKTLEEVAFKNLRSMTPIPPKPAKNGIFISPYQDDYDATRALLTDWIAKASSHGPPVVAIPARGIILIGNENNIPQLLNVAEQLIGTEPHPISARLYKPENNKLVPYSVDQSHPHYGLQNRAFIIDESRAYGEQKDLLNAIHKHNGIDIFIATFNIFGRNGKYLSATTWAEDADSYIPKAEMIFFVCKNKDVIVVNWDDAVKVSGHRMEKVVDLEPPRWHINSFVSADELTALRKHHINLQ